MQGMTVARNVGTADPAFTARSAQTTRSHVTINERPPAIEPSMAGSSISISLHSLPSTTGIGVGNTTSNTGISSGGVNVSSSGGVANGGVAMAGSQNHRLAAASGPGAGAVSAGAG